MTRAVDLTGQVFGRLTVVERAPSQPGKTKWRCRCACGAVNVVATSHLRGGDTTSCGCLVRETTRARATTHGAARVGQHSEEYRSWRVIKARCSNPNHPRYADWGGRGITICDRWRDDFEAFLADAGPKPTPEHSVDRIDNAKGYEPGNCRWATRVEQGRNRRSSTMLTLDGKTQCHAAWAEEYGIHTNTLRARLIAGRPLREALAAPPHPGSAHRAAH